RTPITSEGSAPSPTGPSALQPGRAVLALAAIGACALVMAPWVVRNLHLSGAPFGTAGFAVYQNTAQFLDFPLERTLTPEFGRVTASDFWQKILINTRE